MAIVNHTGAINANETWVATDEHHLTGALYFDAGSLGSEIIVTIEAGVTVYADGDYGVLYATAGNCGRVVHGGTEADKITWLSDPTNFPKPAVSDWAGLVSNNSQHDMDWVAVKHADFFMRFHPAADTANQWVHINNCASIHNATCLENNGGAVTVTQDNFITIDGLYVESNTNFISFNVFGFTGDNTWQNIVLSNVDTRSLALNAGYSYKFDIVNFMSTDGIGYNFPPTGTRNAGQTFDLNISGMFVTGTVQGLPNFAYPNFLIRPTVPLVIEDSVFDHYYQLRLASQQAEAFTVKNSDFVECQYAAINYYSSTPTLIIDSCYFKNCNKSDYVGATGDGPQPSPASWYDNDNAYEPANIKATPVFPLDVENVVEGAPTDSSITITFDAKEGSVTGKRLLGVPFIEYGTTSGGPYLMEGCRSPHGEDLAKTFAKWTTDYGSFTTLNHSVTLSNLEASTTYYYNCCFTDPLGRVATGTEGSFATTAANGGGVAGITDVGEGGIR